MLSEEGPMEWGGGGCFILASFKKTYELKKTRNKQHHCAWATLWRVTDENTSIEDHSVWATHIAHCSASTTRERHLWKATDSIYDSKRPVSYGLLE